MSWRSLAIFGECPGLLMVILLFKMPNSPRYLIIKHKRDEAIKALKMLRGPDSNYIEELDQIQQSVNSQVKTNRRVIEMICCIKKNSKYLYSTVT